MELKNGGQLEKFSDPKILKTIKIDASDSSERRFELWINGESLSYLSLEEVLDLRDEITDAINSALKLS